MTLRSRLMFGLMMALMLVVTAQSSFAQVSIALTANPPSPGEIQTNKNAQTAEPDVTGGGLLITGSLIAASPLTATQLRITYPSPITSSPIDGPDGLGACRDAESPQDEKPCPDGAVPVADPIRIEGATGVFAAVTQPILNTVNSRIEIWLPGSTSNTASGSFRIVGVRIDANGKSGAQSATASLADAASNYLLTTNSVEVISSIANGIASMAVGSRTGSPNFGTASIFTNRTTPDELASFTIVEGFASAFRRRTQLSNSGAAIDNSTRIRLTFNNVPSGVTLTLSINFPSTTTGNALASFLSTPNITSTTNTATIDISGSARLTSTETLEVDLIDITLTSTAAVTTEGAISVTSTFVPIGDALDTTLAAPTDANGYPVFTQLDVGPVTIINIVAANTTMLVPLVEKIGAFDTGISVANTTADPFGGASGGGAVASAGTLKFDFFPSSATGAGTACTLTTSSTNRPGFGISSDGTIASGATYTVLLSQLLPVSNCAAGDFVGYMFITANFLNAHGQATISDFRTYSLAANVLLLPPPATTPRSAPGGGVESLGF